MAMSASSSTTSRPYVQGDSGTLTSTNSTVIVCQEATKDDAGVGGLASGDTLEEWALDTNGNAQPSTLRT